MDQTQTRGAASTGRVLGGRVINAEGHPVPRALVRAVSADGAFWLGGGELGVVPGPVPPIPKPDATARGRPPRGVGWSRRTDANGRFVLVGLPAGAIRLVVDHHELRPAQSGVIDLGRADLGDQRQAVSGEGWLPRCRVVSAGARPPGLRGAGPKAKGLACVARTVAPGAAIVGDMTLSAGGVLRGEVVDDSGRALKHALITARDPGLSRLAYSDESGAFAVAGVLGETEVTAALDGYRSAKAVARVALGDTATVALTLGGAPDTPVASKRGTATLAGHVQEWRTGAPVTRFTVVIDGAQPPIQAGDGRGRFRLSAVAGTRSLRFSAPGFVTRTVAVRVKKPRRRRVSAPLNVELRRAGTVSGEAFDTHGQALIGARIRCAGLSATTDAKGRFELGGVPTGVQEVHLLADDGRVLRSALLSVHAVGPPASVRFDLE